MNDESADTAGREQCRLLAQSRHPDRVGECPLLGVKRTSKFKSVTSAFDHFELQTSAGALGLQLHIVNAATEGELGEAFTTLVQQQAGALLVAADPF
ncbi:MAG: hypothetical protein WAM72_01155, partial [Xanthobacteraceae bacterium]